MMTNINLSSSNNTIHKVRKWHIFNSKLKWMLSLAFFILLGLTWLITTMQEQRREKVVAEAIRQLGGGVHTKQTWLGKLFRDDSLIRVTNVGLEGKSANSQALAYIQGLNHVEALSITDSNDITDADLVHLNGLNELEALWLSGTNISGKGLVHLKGLSNLQILLLNNTQINDDGLLYLQGMPQLHWIDLSNTKVTDAGVKKLKRALPKCIIHVQSPTKQPPAEAGRF